jgi:hypothetical protein
MAGIGLTHEDLSYDYDSRNPQYYRPDAWQMPMNQINTHNDHRQNVAPIQTAQSHGLRQTPTAEHPMMESWRYGQQQQQQIPQSQSSHQQHHHVQQSQSQSQQSPQSANPSHHLDFAPSQPYHMSFGGVYSSLPMGPTPLSMVPVSHSQMIPVSQEYLAMEAGIDGMPQNWAEFHSELVHYSTTEVPLAVSPYQQHTNSPTGSHLEVLSQPSSSDEAGWTMIDARHSFDFEPHFFVDPNQTIHNRTLSESSYSDLEPQCGTFMSNLDMGSNQAVYSPTTLSDSDFEYPHHGHVHRLSIDHGNTQVLTLNPSSMVQPIPVPSNESSSSPIRSPGSQGSAGSPGRKAQRKSLIAAKGTDKVMKRTSTGGKAETEKRVGRRKGPLRPEQRKQASEIRKLRACLRCKFLKKTCDKGEPCAGCKPSHARLWQVPCTRIDIKEIGYFLKDWKFDYERHISLGFSVGNIKGFSDTEKTLWITHGYGHMLPVTAREVYVRDEDCLKMDWMEANRAPDGYEISTAKLSAGMEGISTTMLSDYLDRHIDGTGTFEKFVDDYFEGTPFLSQMLKTAYHFYCRTGSKIIKKALKLMLAYNLTLHITMVEGVPSEEGFIGKIEEETSKFYGKTIAPVMINFQIKCAMADMWRELHKDVLEELSSLYSSVYSGDKLKNWPTIFILASVLLAVWECMQFDCHYRVPDNAAVEKFCNDMETTPVGVIIGLFQAISQKLPALIDWDTSKHHTLLGSNNDVCDTMSEVREHVVQYGKFCLHVY